MSNFNRKTLYCYQGNESAIGTSVFDNPKRRTDALPARDMALSGPYTLLQGGLGLVARNPIYLTEADGREKFWLAWAATNSSPSSKEAPPRTGYDS